MVSKHGSRTACTTVQTYSQVRARHPLWWKIKLQIAKEQVQNRLVNQQVCFPCGGKSNCKNAKDQVQKRLVNQQVCLDDFVC